MALSFNNVKSNRQQLTNAIQKQGSAVSNMIKNEEANSYQLDKNKLLNYFKGRSEARNDINSGKISSGNKAQDVFETRMGKLVDLYLDETSKVTDRNGMPMFTSDKIIEASKNPSKVVKDMKAYYQYQAPDKVWAIDDYIQKGGMASNVFEYLEDISGSVTNPYGKIEVKGNVFKEDTPEAAKGVASFGSFLSSLGTNIAGKITGNSWLQDKTYNLEHKIWDTANDEEYKLYKSGKAPKDVSNVNIFGQSKAKFYDDYTKAQEDGFIGTVDEYKNFKKNVSNVTNNAISERMKEGILTDEDIDSSTAAIASDGLAELVTYLSVPFFKGVKIENPLVNELTNLVVDSLINTAELEGMENLKGDPMTKGEVGLAEGINLLVGGITRSPVIAKYVKDLMKSKGVKGGFSDWLATVPEQVKNAYERLSADQLKNIKSLSKKTATESSAKAANKGVRYFGQQGIDAADKSLNEYLAAGAKLGKEGQNLRNSGITKDLIESEMNKSLKNLENKDYMGDVKWGEGQAPQIHITETSAGPEIHISNKENLNMVKNGEGKGLGDALEDIFYGMFGKGNNKAGAGIELNEASMLAFMNEVKGATQGTEWSWGNMGAKAFGDGLDAFRANANLPESFTKAEADFFNKRDLHNLISDSFGSYGKYSSEVDKVSKQFTAGQKLQDKKLQGILEQAQDAGYISDTIDAEIIAYGYMLALQDEAAARAFFGNIYPSKPGFIEAIFESARNSIKEGTIDKYIASKEAKDTISKGPGQMLDRMMERRNGIRTADKGFGGAFNIMKNRISDLQENQEDRKNNQWSFTDEEYAEFINNMMK